MPTLDALQRLDQAAARWENARKTVRANAAKIAAHAAKRLRVGDEVTVAGVRYLIAEVTWPVEISDRAGKVLKGKDAEAVEQADQQPRRAKALLRFNTERAAWAALHDPRKSPAPDGYRYRPVGEELTVTSGHTPAEASLAEQEDFIAFSNEMDSVLDAFVARLEVEQAELERIGSGIAANDTAENSA